VCKYGYKLLAACSGQVEMANGGEDGCLHGTGKTVPLGVDDDLLKSMGLWFAHMVF
jgi:hypothetical protein